MHFDFVFNHANIIKNLLSLFVYKCRTVYYGEYKCSGPGSNLSKRAPWARMLRDEEAQLFIGIDYIQGDTWLISP